MERNRTKHDIEIKIGIEEKILSDITIRLKKNVIEIKIEIKIEVEEELFYK